MRRSEWEDRCKKHIDHRLSKGVCPFCLREKLTHLSASSSVSNTTHASSNSTNNSVYSSNSNLSSAQTDQKSPTHLNDNHSSNPNFDDQALQKSLSNPNFDDQALKKSRSLAFEMREAKEEDRIEMKNKKKKKKIERFFSRIIHGHGSEKEKKKESSDLFHSKTMKEKSSTKWVLF